MVIAYQCPRCRNRTFKISKNEFDAPCKKCIKELESRGVILDRTRNIRQDSNDKILANNMETVADVWKDRSFVPVSEGPTAVSADSGNAKIQCEKPEEHN